MLVDPDRTVDNKLHLANVKSVNLRLVPTKRPSDRLLATLYTGMGIGSVLISVFATQSKTETGKIAFDAPLRLLHFSHRFLDPLHQLSLRPAEVANEHDNDRHLFETHWAQRISVPCVDAPA